MLFGGVSIRGRDYCVMTSIDPGGVAIVMFTCKKTCKGALNHGVSTCAHAWALAKQRGSSRSVHPLDFFFRPSVEMVCKKLGYPALGWKWNVILRPTLSWTMTHATWVCGEGSAQLLGQIISACTACWLSRLPRWNGVARPFGSTFCLVQTKLWERKFLAVKYTNREGTGFARKKDVFSKYGKIRVNYGKSWVNYAQITGRNLENQVFLLKILVFSSKSWNNRFFDFNPKKVG